jgi:hypothetical protein
MRGGFGIAFNSTLNYIFQPSIFFSPQPRDWQFFADRLAVTKAPAMIANTAYIVALVASLLWFGEAFRYFSFQQFAASKVLVPASARSSPIFLTLAASIRFLGGMNGAFALMSAVLLICALTGSEAFVDADERGILLCVLAAAHFSQFVFNLPILLAGERQGESYWYVRSGPMLFIFVVDALETVINLGAAMIQFAA